MAKSLFGSIFSAVNQASKSAERERIQMQKRIDKQRQLELKEQLKYQAKLQKFVLEFPRHKQIIDESVNLLETTNSLTIANGRFNTAVSHYNWMKKQKQIDMPVVFYEESCGFENSLKRTFNENIERIVEFTYNKDIAQIIKTKNTESKRKKILKLKDIISAALPILKAYENKSLIAETIRDYRTKLKNEL